MNCAQHAAQTTPAREFIAPEMHWRSSLPRYATGPTQETGAIGTASRGQAEGQALAKAQ
jgi:hypothetical protein